MNRLTQSTMSIERVGDLAAELTEQWPPLPCEPGEGSTGVWSFGTRNPWRETSKSRRGYDEDWVDAVPRLVANLTSLVEEKKKQELRFNLLDMAVVDFEWRIHRLESIQTRVVPIDTFAPEPYDLVRTVLVSVHCVEGGFNAGWFDANIHASGDNEEEAIRNLKSLILDFFDHFSSEPPERLGPEPTRQLAVLKQYIHKKH